MRYIKILVFCLAMLISSLELPNVTYAQTSTQPEIEVSDNIKLYLLSTEFEKLRLFTLDLQKFKETAKTLISKAEKINLKLEVLIDNLNEAQQNTEIVDQESQTVDTNEQATSELPVNINTKQTLTDELNLIMQQLANVKEINNNFGINFTDLKINSRSDIINEVERLQKIIRVIKENLVVIYNAQLNLLTKVEGVENQ